MANRLKMAEVNAVLQLRERGWSFRRIARKLGVLRDAVGCTLIRLEFVIPDAYDEESGLPAADAGAVPPTSWASATRGPPSPSTR